jgi:hypothetical protein
MKGIVMEVEGKDLVVMKKNGEFINMKKESQSVCVGQEISFSSVKVNRKRALRRLTALAASFLIFIGAGAGGYAYYTPKGYVDVDINPGIELAYNRWDKVIKVSGANVDGERVLEIAGNLKNKGVGTAVKMILEAAKEEDFFSEDNENVVNVLVSGRNNLENLEKAKNAIKNYHAETGLQFSYNAETESMERYKAFKIEADGLHITPGKLNLLKKVYGEDQTVGFYREYSTKSVKDIMQSFNRGMGNGNEGKEQKEGKEENEEENGNIEESGNATSDSEKGNSGKGNNGNGK